MGPLGGADEHLEELGKLAPNACAFGAEQKPRDRPVGTCNHHPQL